MSTGSSWRPRARTTPVAVGALTVGGDSPVSVQSMLKAPSHDIGAITAQLDQLAAAGCEICRVAVPDRTAADRLAELVARSPMPLVADIHFDYRLALAAIDAGVAKLRINPGNIGGPDQVRAVAAAAQAAKVAIRVGVNLGSLEQDLAERYGHGAEAMAESAMRQIRLLEDLGCRALIISAKAPDVARTVGAYRLLAEQTEWPLHLGVTEAGPGVPGLVKSTLGVGLLLSEGIGDTIRVSLSGPPVDEIRAGQAILQGLELRAFGPDLVSCPTCGRCQFDLLSLVPQVERRLQSVTEPLTVAVMGCAVNGPGEARRADVGIAGAAGGQAVLFAAGQVLRAVSAERALDELCGEIDRILATRQGRPQAPGSEPHEQQ